MKGKIEVENLIAYCNPLIINEFKIKFDANISNVKIIIS